MFELLYNFWGYNKTLFITLNEITNIGIIPYILLTISKLFIISNFAFLYIGVCIFYLFKIKKNNGNKSYFIQTFNLLTKIGIYYAIFGLTFAFLKFSVNLPRPFCSLNQIEFVTIENIQLERCHSSFPSAHTGICILIVYCLWAFVESRFLKLLLCLMVIIVALSRICLAMHYPADIIYSAIVTLLVIQTSNYLLRFIYKPLIKPIRKLFAKIIL